MKKSGRINFFNVIMEAFVFFILLFPIAHIVNLNVLDGFNVATAKKSLLDYFISLFVFIYPIFFLCFLLFNWDTKHFKHMNVFISYFLFNLAIFSLFVLDKQIGNGFIFGFVIYTLVSYFFITFVVLIIKRVQMYKDKLLKFLSFFFCYFALLMLAFLYLFTIKRML